MMKLSPAVMSSCLEGTDKTSAYVLADLLGTITYEITCMIGNRVRRIYT